MCGFLCRLVSWRSLLTTSEEQAIEQISVDYTSEPLEIGFNIHFLIEALSVMSGDSVSVELSSPNSPCKLQDPDDPSAQFIISPMVL